MYRVRVTKLVIFLISGHVIEQLGDLTKINYMEFRAMWPVSGRDFCVFDAIRVLPDNTYVLVVKSVSTSSGWKYVYSHASYCEELFHSVESLMLNEC